MLGRDAVAHGKAEPGSPGNLLGREERLEQPGLDLGRHADPLIRHLDPNIVAGKELGAAHLLHRGEGDVGGPDRHPATGGHGIPGIHHQVDDQLVDLGPIGTDRCQIVGQLDDQVHLVAAEPMEESFEIGDHLGQQDGRALGLLAAGKHEQLLGDQRRPLTGLANLLEVGQDVGAIVGRRLGQFGKTEHPGHHIVDFVSHTTRQAPDALELLGLEQLVLEPLPLGQLLGELGGPLFDPKFEVGPGGDQVAGSIVDQVAQLSLADLHLADSDPIECDATKPKPKHHQRKEPRPVEHFGGDTETESDLDRVPLPVLVRGPNHKPVVATLERPVGRGAFVARLDPVAIDANQPILNPDPGRHQCFGGREGHLEPVNPGRKREGNRGVTSDAVDHDPLDQDPRRQ